MNFKQEINFIFLWFDIFRRYFFPSRSGEKIFTLICWLQKNKINGKNKSMCGHRTFTTHSSYNGSIKSVVSSGNSFSFWGFSLKNWFFLFVFSAINLFLCYAPPRYVCIYWFQNGLSSELLLSCSLPKKYVNPPQIIQFRIAHIFFPLLILVHAFDID